MVLNLICHYVRSPPTLRARDNKIVRVSETSGASEAGHVSQPVRGLIIDKNWISGDLNQKLLLP